jgi:NADH dehydrogenase
VVLIDRQNYHLFQPLLYEVATAALSPGNIATPLREVVRGQTNTEVLMGEVAQFNLPQKQILLTEGDTLNYDHLVIAVGARHSYFGNDAWEPFAPGLKTVSDALLIRERILATFERAERLKACTGKEVPLNFVLVGGGPTGVEMAGAIAEITNQTLTRNFRHIDPSKAKIYLVEALDTILPMFPKKLSRAAHEMLEEMGVTVWTNKKVTAVSADGVHVDNVFIPSENVIWAAGNQVSPLLKSLGVPLDKAGRAIVEPDLSLPGYPDVFVIGDAAHVRTGEGKSLPGVAQVAMQEGRYVARLIRKQIPQGKRAPFHYHDKGSMATIGKAKAIAHIGSFEFAGFFAWLIWAFIHILFLIGFRNRLGVLLEWATALCTGARGVRLITKPLDPQQKG